MIAHGVDREANDLAVALREFRFGLGEIAELGGADRREILGVREKHSPRVTDPLMEVDTSLGGVGREIGSAITYSERHDILLCLGIAAIAKWGHVNHCERSEEHTSELQSLMRISYAVFCLKKKKHKSSNLNILAQLNTNHSRDR